MGRTVVVWLIQTRQHEHGHIAFQFSSSQASLSTLYGQGGQWGTVYHTHRAKLLGFELRLRGPVAWFPGTQLHKGSIVNQPSRWISRTEWCVMVWYGKTGLSKAHRNEPSLWASCPSSRSTSLVRSGLSMTNQKRPSMSFCDGLVWQRK